MSGLYVMPSNSSELTERLEEYRTSVLAEYILLAHTSGTVIAESGELPLGDASMFAALTAATFQSTGQIAQLMMEKNFAKIIQNGENRSLMMMNLTETSVTVLVFPTANIDQETQDIVLQWQEAIRETLIAIGGTQFV